MSDSKVESELEFLRRLADGDPKGLTLDQCRGFVVNGLWKRGLVKIVHLGLDYKRVRLTEDGWLALQRGAVL